MLPYRTQDGWVRCSSNQGVGQAVARPAHLTRSNLAVHDDVSNAGSRGAGSVGSVIQGSMTFVPTQTGSSSESDVLEKPISEATMLSAMQMSEISAPSVMHMSEITAATLAMPCEVPAPSVMQVSEITAATLVRFLHLTVNDLMLLFRHT